MYQRCTRCVMDNVSDKTISFDSYGHCNYCNDVLKRMPKEYFPNMEGKHRLDSLILQMKDACKDAPYDCMVGASGGIDSSYILYLGFRYHLRMLAVHIDDGLDNPIATENLKKIIERTKATMVTIQPDHQEYADLLLALFKASVPNLAIGQDNLIISALQKYGERNHIRYSLDGNNFAHESILEHSSGVNACDKRYIYAIQTMYGSVPSQKLEFCSLTDRYLRRHSNKKVQHVRPLNMIPYNLDQAIDELEEFCGFEYYGGKHYESILTRFMQCYYLPVKFGLDKRKSHFSSLIVSGQMSREEALVRLEEPLYPSEELLQKDEQFLADYMGISVAELESYIDLPPKKELDYPHSFLNELAPAARMLRKFLE